MLNKLKVSNNTRRKYLLIIRMFLKWLVDEGHLSKKPTDGIRIKADDFNGEFYTQNRSPPQRHSTTSALFATAHSGIFLLEFRAHHRDHSVPSGMVPLEHHVVSPLRDHLT